MKFFVRNDLNQLTSQRGFVFLAGGVVPPRPVVPEGRETADTQLANILEVLKPELEDIDRDDFLNSIKNKSSLVGLADKVKSKSLSFKESNILGLALAQFKYGIKVDGIYGPESAKTLRRAVAIKQTRDELHQIWDADLLNIPADDKAVVTLALEANPKVSNEKVIALQKLLVEKGYMTGKGRGRVDGRLGPITLQALHRYMDGSYGASLNISDETTGKIATATNNSIDHYSGSLKKMTESYRKTDEILDEIQKEIDGDPDSFWHIFQIREGVCGVSIDYLTDLFQDDTDKAQKYKDIIDAKLKTFDNQKFERALAEVFGKELGEEISDQRKDSLLKIVLFALTTSVHLGSIRLGAGDLKTLKGVDFDTITRLVTWTQDGMQGEFDKRTSGKSFNQLYQAEQANYNKMRAQVNRLGRKGTEAEREKASKKLKNIGENMDNMVELAKASFLHKIGVKKNEQGEITDYGNGAGAFDFGERNVPFFADGWDENEGWDYPAYKNAVDEVDRLDKQYKNSVDLEAKGKHRTDLVEQMKKIQDIIDKELNADLVDDYLEVVEQKTQEQMESEQKERLGTVDLENGITARWSSKDKKWDYSFENKTDYSYFKKIKEPFESGGWKKFVDGKEEVDETKNALEDKINLTDDLSLRKLFLNYDMEQLVSEHPKLAKLAGLIKQWENIDELSAHYPMPKKLKEKLNKDFDQLNVGDLKSALDDQGGGAWLDAVTGGPQEYGKYYRETILPELFSSNYHVTLKSDPSDWKWIEKGRKIKASRSLKHGAPMAIPKNGSSIQDSNLNKENYERLRDFGVHPKQVAEARVRSGLENILGSLSELGIYMTSDQFKSAMNKAVYKKYKGEHFQNKSRTIGDTEAIKALQDEGYFEIKHKIEETVTDTDGKKHKISREYDIALRPDCGNPMIRTGHIQIDDEPIEDNFKQIDGAVVFTTSAGIPIAISVLPFLGGGGNGGGGGIMEKVVQVLKNPEIGANNGSNTSGNFGTEIIGSVFR